MVAICLTIKIGNESAERGEFLQKGDTPPLVTWADVPAALGLLTRLPIRVDADAAMERGAASAWAYPIVGICIAFITWVFATLFLWLGLPPLVIATFCLIVPVVLTGAMHEDGLADCADGLWGGWTKERRLEIMKDSRIGAYGVLALALSMMLRFGAVLGVLSTDAFWPALIVAATVSRTNMVVLMTFLPHAREGGLSQSVGRPSQSTMLVGCGVAIFVTLFFAGWATPFILVVAALSAFACAAIAKAKIGGQTGDVLGATQQATEIVILICFATIAV